MDFEIIGEITQIETFARGLGVDVRQHLNRQYAGGRKMRWRHCKGIALIKWLIPPKRGRIEMAEIHWFQAHGIGRVGTTYKRSV